jgi:IclR family KDG regulon transcriptional repressor
MSPAFKRVPAIDKCFAILELLAQSKEPMGISGISGKLDLNKSTVFNIVHTLMDLNVLDNQADGKFVFGTRFYILGNMSGKRSELIQTAHPYLETINEKTKLSAFLGLRSDGHAILIDKVDSAYGIKLSSEIGMRMPILAGAGIKAMLRKQGIAYDREEYIEGMVALAIPIKANGRDLQAAIWAVGLTRQVPKASIPELTEFLKGISEEINYRLQ